jgi:glutamine synthetase
MPRPVAAPDTAHAQRFIDEGVRDVECLFPDVSGVPRGKLMPAARFAAGDELRICQAIAMQCVTGEYPVDPIFPPSDPDVRMQPDLSTLRRAPWSSVPRYLAIHDLFELDGRPCAFAPRQVLREVLARYAAHGWSPVVAPEIEFYLLRVEGDQALHLPVTGHGAREAGASAFSLHGLHELAPFWDEFHAALDTLGVRADTWLHEVGPSQFEINLLHGDALAAADQAFLFKLAARQTALRHGLDAVFMAKPLAGEAGSSMHLHTSVVDAQGHNLFTAGDGSATPAFEHFIGGLQAHGPELMAFFAPFFNSYRRFVRNSQAPINLHWGLDNRTSGLRVPHSAPAARRVENRVAGADANPYLAIAATLAAGLAGIERQCEPTEPVQGDGYDEARTLPVQLHDALQRLRASRFAAEALGPDFVQAYLSVKATELDHFMREISAWERRYLAPMA